MEHVLLEQSHRFPIIPEPEVTGWEYSRKVGVWVATNPPGPQDPRKPAPDPNPPRPRSKKCDVETGEDMKGA
jgi:hypothetical protein